MGNKRNFFNKKGRIVSKKTLPPGKDTCNSKLRSRDGYCASPGVIPFSRCRQHGGSKEMASMDLFKKAIGLEDASKLQILIDDTLSMDNELATAKTMLLDIIEQWKRATYIIDQFMNNIPERPQPGSSQTEVSTFGDAVQLHNDVLDHMRKIQEKNFKQAHSLIRTLAIGVHRNSKIKEGAKFTLDARQIASILKVQLEVMKEHCKGCPKLRSVLKGIQEGTRDIPIHGNFSESNKKAMGARMYKDMVKNVNEIGEEIYPEDDD